MLGFCWKRCAEWLCAFSLTSTTLILDHFFSQAKTSTAFHVGTSLEIGPLTPICSRKTGSYFHARISLFEGRGGVGGGEEQ